MGETVQLILPAQMSPVTSASIQVSLVLVVFLFIELKILLSVTLLHAFDQCTLKLLSSRCLPPPYPFCFSFFFWGILLGFCCF